MTLRSTLVLVSALASLPAVALGQALVLEGKRIYTAPDAAPLDAGVVHVSGGKIVAVGPKTGSPTDITDTHCGGGVITAGFQNSHVHFTEAKWNDAGKQPAAELSKHLAAMLTRYGFTTVVDTASDLDNTVALRTRIERREVRGPRILTAGWALYPPDGIPSYLRDLPPEVLKRLPQPTTAEEAVSVVRRNFSGGADLTKLFVLTPQADGSAKAMPLEVARAAVAETHKRSRLVVAHPTDIPGIRTALTAGVDVIVHTTLGNARTEWEPALIEQMIARDLAVVPTLKLWRYELTKARVAERIIGLAVGDSIEQLRAFSEAGGQVLFGTDVGYMTEYDPTDEYLLMQRAGLTAAQILASLTSAPAARWKEEQRRGRVAAGMDADLVVLSGDPAQDVRSFANVRCVYRQGQLIYPLTKQGAAPSQSGATR
jgi:imidazolonepropionase-like amidohydrolase